MTVSKQFYTFVDTLDGAVYHRFFDEDGVDKMEKIEEYDYTLYVEHPSDFSGQLSLTGKRLKEIRFKTVQEMGKFYFENKDRMEIHGNNSAAIQFIAKEYKYDVKQTCPINILNFDLEMEHGAGLIVYPDDYQVKCQDTNGNIFYTPKGEIKNRNLIVFDDRYKRWEEFKDSCFYPIGFPKPEQARGEIISASLKKFGDNEVMYSLGTKPLTEYDNPKGKYIQCKDEKELLVQFLKLWREINPHIVTGWNCIPLTNSVWQKDRIVQLKDVKYKDNLYDSSVTDLFPITKKSVNVMTLSNYQKIRSSEDHIFPIHWLPKGKYIADVKSLISEDATVKQIGAMLDDRNVYARVELNQNKNADLTYRTLIMNNYDLLKEKGVLFKVKDNELVKKVSAMTGDTLRWKDRSIEVWNDELIINSLTKKEFFEYVNRVTEIGVCPVDNLNRRWFMTLDLDEVISEDLMWWLGMWYTDGTSSYKNEVTLCNKNMDVSNRVKSVHNTEFDHDSTIVINKRDGCGYTRLSLLKCWLHKLFIYDGYQTASKKKINVQLMSQLSNKQFMAFYAGCIDGDGFVDEENGSILLSNYNDDIESFVELLQWNGIFSTCGSNYVRSYIPNEYFNSNLVSHHKIVDRLMDTQERFTKSKNRRWIFGDDCVYVRIESVEDTKQIVEMRDITTTTHYFVSGGVKTHNCKGFDVPYLINRLKKVLGEKALAYLSPFKDKVKNNKKLIITKNNALMTTYEIFGITIYDYLEVYQKYNLTKQESYKLDHIGQVEIGQNKVRFDEYNKSLMNLYEGVINTDLTTPFKELDTIMKYARIREVTRRTLKKVGYESDRHLGDELFKFDAETFDFTVIKDADNDTLKGMYNYADERVKTLSYKKFISYNEQDANIVEEIDKKRRYIQMALRIAHMTKSKPKEIFGTVAPWDNMLYARLLERNVQIPPRQENSKKEKYPGAYVKKPVLGPHKWVTTVDAGSLYPNTIIACNMSPEMMVKTQDINYFETLEKLFNRELDTSDIVKRGHVIAANGAVFKQEQVGVIPDAMEYLITERKVVKNRMKDQNRLLQKELSILEDLKQGKEVEGRTYEEVFKLCLELEDEVSTLHATEQALKILANSGYGALGEASFRYFRVDIATAITLTGRLFVISHVSKVVNDHLNKVCGTTDVEYCIYGDTDSVFIKLDAWVKMHKFDETNIDFVVTQIDEYMQNVIEPLIEESYIDLMAYIGAKRNDRMVMKREVISDSCIFRGKKNYMMQVWDNEGVRYSAAYYKRMGIETAKTSTAQIIRDKLEECLNIVINFEHQEPSQLKSIVDDFREEFNKVDILSIAKPSGVNDIEKWLDDKGNIISGCPIHIRGAIVYNQFINSTPELKNAYEEIKDGDKIKFVNLKLPNILHSHVVAFIDDIPPEMEILESIDRKTQFEKTFMKPLESFTELINWDVRREFNITSLFDDGDWDSTVVEEKEKVKKREVIVTSTIDDLFG